MIKDEPSPFTASVLLSRERIGRGMVVVTHDCVHCLAPPGGRDSFRRDDYADIVRCYRFRCLTADLSKRLGPLEQVWEAVAVDMDPGYGAIPFQKE
ncbi:hypothetical protein RJ40_05425 [Methanofollis aquaemaris]|uniref:Uncharacterized protein n=1 Tax=Methanofollis aquaemaris TaxID=126734 RepID=A0A8A3S4I7_9EURY|nr:hypothetical protein [Methanofollis aquaemaris]QSZ66972.1 hypothetical protein RJ40_05425 [Methanofollis aquaemaris]